MTTVTNFLVPPSASAHLRSFDIRRDLGPVADLVEQCFADTLDPEGERYLQQMRTASRNQGFLRWAAAAAEWASVPLSGYVWEEDDRLVGNVSLIPFTIRARRYFLIANVGVHPDYRRRGIARSLTAKAVEHARRRAAPAAWLHVRQENEGAVNLYRSLGFIERARRTTWYSNPDVQQGDSPAEIRLVERSPQHWGAQRAWLQRSYPPELTWHLPLRMSALRPGLLGAFYRLLNASYLVQWTALEGDRLKGVLAWQATRSYNDNLWLALPSENVDKAAIYALLLYARQHISPRRPLALDYPSGVIDDVIRAAGFHAHQTLIWMSIPFHSNQ